MSTVLAFDQLNKGYTERAVDYETYFGEMDLTEEQVRERIGFAEAIEADLASVLETIATLLLIGIAVDYESLRSRLVDRYCEIAIQYTDDYEWILERAEEFIGDFLTATAGNIDDPWYTSDDRAKWNAENEANTALNHDDFITAVLDGKKNKQWIDMKDNRERKTHLQVGSTIIPITDYFEVGNSLMLYPKDESMGAEAKEIVNCRCSVRYF